MLSIDHVHKFFCSHVLCLYIIVNDPAFVAYFSIHAFTGELLLHISHSCLVNRDLLIVTSLRRGSFAVDLASHHDIGFTPIVVVVKLRVDCNLLDHERNVSQAVPLTILVLSFWLLMHLLILFFEVHLVAAVAQLDVRSALEALNTIWINLSPRVFLECLILLAIGVEAFVSICETSTFWNDK